MSGDAGQGLQTPVSVVTHSEVWADYQMPHPELFVKYPQKVVRRKLSEPPVELDRDYHIHAKLLQEPRTLIRSIRKRTRVSGFRTVMGRFLKVTTQARDPELRACSTSLADQVSMTPVNAVEHAYGDSRVAVNGEMGEDFV